MDHTDPTIAEPTEARHELRIMQAEFCPYLAYCPCGDFVLETSFPDEISSRYRKHLNDPSVPADA
jgi:hypothetical protein